MKLIIRLIISFIVFVLTAIFFTEILRHRIFFSLFVGIPLGAIAGLLAYTYLYFKNRK